MRRQIPIIFVLVLFLCGSASHGEWRMQVRQSQRVDEFVLADVDSVTFYPATSMFPEMVPVPSGDFVMGDGEMYPPQIREHIVYLTNDFELGQHEVTNGEFMQALQWAYDHGYVTATMNAVYDNLDGSNELIVELNSNECEIRFDGAWVFRIQEASYSQLEAIFPDGYDPTDHPVKRVTWYGAARYCDWLSMQAGLPRAYEHTGDWACNGWQPYMAQGYRLPTEAEWEYAAQFEDERKYPWGGSAPDCSKVNYNDGSGSFGCVGWSSPVNSYPPAPYALGLADMAGNVQEWCNDWYEELDTVDTVINPVGPGTGISRVLRSCFWSSGAIATRCSARVQPSPESSPGASVGYHGFRIARTITP